MGHRVVATPGSCRYSTCGPTGTTSGARFRVQAAPPARSAAVQAIAMAPPAEQRARLRQMRDYYVFMTEQLEALLAEYTSRVTEAGR
ncbi:hypothetical protein [Amycolatopsis sp. NPDC051061]|uniref:hypothetical protein n=1 Tax=Amycolatopsis sp. NPDC051061 TaxID=3155042 RepID=UPI003433566E